MKLFRHFAHAPIALAAAERLNAHPTELGLDFHISLVDALADSLAKIANGVNRVAEKIKHHNDNDNFKNK